MSGTKRIYGLDEKNYFKFFGIDEKQGISVRSLTTHYKKIIAILKKDTSFEGISRLEFAKRAFETLADPISRARYILELHKEGITPHIQVHDELDISVDNNADKIKEIMESAVELEVPNKVDYESGPNWGTIK